MPDIKSLSVRHNEIMDYLMANPQVKLRDVAQHFGMTQSWLSIIIHSDLFQIALKEKQGIAFHHTVLPIREKLVALAHQSLDRIADTLPLETETKVLKDVAADVLDRIGFGSKTPVHTGGAPAVNVQVNVLKSALEDARSLLGKAASARVEVQIDGQRAPIGLSRMPEPSLGSVIEGEAVPIGV